MSQAALYWCCYYGLEATFLSFLLLNPGYPGFGAFPRRRPLHGLSYPWVSGSSAVVTLPLCHSILATPSRATPYLGDALLGDALPGRRFMLTLTLTSSTPGYATVHDSVTISDTEVFMFLASLT